jgi:hypothetical protein
LAIKTYAGFGNKYRLPVGLEHGTHLEDVYDGYELQEEKDNLPGLFVFSENSKKIYSKHTTKEIIVIGPYIHYVKSLLNKNDFLKEKGRLGKSLLIIPNHSDVISQIVYDNHSYLKKIKNIANDFDSVRVCLHWNDVQNKFYDHYREMGWECVSAGHETNNYFLSRLRSIIELSDFVLSDNITTALGYSIYLKKPVMLIKSEAHAVITSKRKGLDETKINKLVNGPVNELFYDCFSVYSDNINNDQLELVEQYWGLSHLKTKKEMREIIMHFDEQLENGRLNSKRGQDYVQNA